MCICVKERERGEIAGKRFPLVNDKKDASFSKTDKILGRRIILLRGNRYVRLNGYVLC